MRLIRQSVNFLLFIVSALKRQTLLHVRCTARILVMGARVHVMEYMLRGRSMHRLSFRILNGAVQETFDHTTKFTFTLVSYRNTNFLYRTAKGARPIYKPS